MNENIKSIPLNFRLGGRWEVEGLLKLSLRGQRGDLGRKLKPTGGGGGGAEAESPAPTRRSLRDTRGMAVAKRSRAGRARPPTGGTAQLFLPFCPRAATGPRECWGGREKQDPLEVSGRKGQLSPWDRTHTGVGRPVLTRAWEVAELGPQAEGRRSRTGDFLRSLNSSQPLRTGAGPRWLQTAPGSSEVTRTVTLAHWENAPGKMIVSMRNDSDKNNRNYPTCKMNSFYNVDTVDMLSTRQKHNGSHDTN